MPVVVLGASHSSAPIDVLERLSIPDERLPAALNDLVQRDHIEEAVVLSTCNRTEVYTLASTFHGGVGDLNEFLSEFCGVPPEELSDITYTHQQVAAVRHVFRVTAGLDSMILGEPEILGQVRRAYRAAADEGTARRVLGDVFRCALKVGKRARSETEIARNPVSVPTTAVQFVKQAWGEPTLSNARVVIVGAGAMARLAAQALRKAGAGDLVVVNRSAGRGRELADRCGGRFVSIGLLAHAISTADVVICATNSPEPIIDRASVEQALELRGRSGRLIIVDIAVPRDVDPRAAEIPGVALHHLADLRAVVDANLGRRVREASKVEAIIADEVGGFTDAERVAELAPILSALVAKADAIREQEIARLQTLGNELPPELWAIVEQLSRRIVSKLLHAPLTKAKELQASDDGIAHVAALQALFDLDANRPSRASGR